MTDLANKSNYLFSLMTILLNKSLEDLSGSDTSESFKLGIGAYQAVNLLVRPEDPSFARPPEETAAMRTIFELRPLRGYDLIEEGINSVKDLENEAPLLTDISTEIVERFSNTKGDKRVAMGGVALMRRTHIVAENRLLTLNY